MKKIAQYVYSPFKIMKELVTQAFELSGKKSRDAMRSLRLILNLAATRGFHHSREFITYFQSHDINAANTRKWFNKVFDFVSSDELRIMLNRQTHQR